MNCEHKHIRCTDCRFYCMDCGEELTINRVDEVETKEPKRRRKAKE